MITLDNISMNRLYISLYEPKIYKWLKAIDCKSVQDVLDNVENLFDKPQLRRIYLEAEVIKRKITALNKKGKELNIYETNRFENTKYTDDVTPGSVLLLKNPTLSHSALYHSIRDKSISQIKDNLGLITEYGDNYLIYSSRNIGKESIQKILEALGRYDQQVLKQSKDVYKKENIFLYNHDEKATIVSYNYNDIINYFVDNNRDLLWGNMSDSQKRMYLSSINRKTENERRIRKEIINYIANYTTLDELETIKEDDYKVLEKFMK